MAEEKKNQFKCSGDCLNCRKQPNERREQWQYCAAQFTYNSMRMIENLHSELKSMQGTVVEMKEKIEAIESNEADVYSISNGVKSEFSNLPIAQEGDGAEE